MGLLVRVIELPRARGWRAVNAGPKRCVGESQLAVCKDTSKAGRAHGQVPFRSLLVQRDRRDAWGRKRVSAATSPMVLAAAPVKSVNPCPEGPGVA